MFFKKLSIYFFVLTVILTSGINSFAQTSGLNSGQDSYLDSLYSVMKNMPEDSAKLEVYSQIYHGHYNLDSIVKYSVLAYNLAKNLSYQRQMAEALMFTGATYNAACDNKTAADYFYRSLTIWTGLNDTTKQAVCYNCLAVIMENLNDYSTAIDYYHKALNLFNLKGDTARVGRIYRGLSNTYNGFNLLEAAKDCALKALSTDTLTLDFAAVSFDLMYLGNAYMAQYSGNYKPETLLEARKYYLMGLKKAQQSNFLEAIIDLGLELQKSYLEEFSLKKTSLRGKQILDSSLFYGDLAKVCIDKMRNLVKDYVYKINNCRYLLLLGRTKEAGKEIEDMKKTFISDLGRYESLYYKDLGPVMKIYYQNSKDYKSLYDFIEDYQKYRNRRFNLDYTIKDLVLENRREFEKNVKKLDDELLQREKKYENLKKIRFVMWAFMSVLLVFLTVCVVIFVKRLKANKIQNLKLLASTSEITLVNGGLERIYAKILAQNNEIAAQNKQIEEQKNSIRYTNRAIIYSIEYARNIQKASMPSLAVMKNIFKSYFLIFKPLEIVSGDFYWASQVGDFKIIGVFDSTGHGISGGLLSMFGIATLNDIIAKAQLEDINAAYILNKLRLKIITCTSDDNYDGMDAGVCVIDTKNKKFGFAGAMRPLWHFSGGVLTEILPERMSVSRGKYQDTDFSCRYSDYLEGDRVYIFTDGMTDIFGISDEDPQKLKKFSQKRMKELLKNIQNESLEVQKDIIEKTLEDWQKGLSNDSGTDDRLMVAISL